jgi:N utilization substance protein B
MLRRKSREIALQALFQYQLRKGELPDPLDFAWLDQAQHPSIISFARELIQGCLANLDEVDKVILPLLVNWKEDRLAIVDRAILRLSVFSLLKQPDIPAASVIDEAVQLAQKYGDEKSYIFVNGVLDAVARSLKRT